MRRHLPTVYRVNLAHPLLDKRVPGFTEHRLSSPRASDSLGIPGQARVMNDALRAQARQKGLGQQADNVVALDEVAGAVEEKAAIEISIPRNTQICLLCHHPLGSRRAILYQQRIWNPVREVSIGLMVYLNELKREMGFQCINHAASPAVSRGTDDFQRRKGVDVDIGQQMFDVRVQRRDRSEIAARGRGREGIALRQRANLQKPRVAGDWL